MNPLLSADERMIERMEDDLRKKIQIAIDCKPQLNMGVYGIFSIDDLEAKLERDFGGGIGVGVQYVMAESTDLQSRPGGGGARVVRYSFQVILAVPNGMDSAERLDATFLLSMLRLAIIGKPLEGDRVARAWDFAHERAEPGASSSTMLYYSQLWQLTMPLVGA